MWCSSPITIYKRGNPPPVNPQTGFPEWPQVACGKCRTCVAGRKNDWTGRLTAEAMASADVYFVTLTYRDEPSEFRYSDVQLMLKRLRVDLERKYDGAKLRFFCVGERGNKFGRIHWHLLLFVDQRLGWSNWNKHTHRKELWRWWPHGWTDLAKVPSHDTVRRVRYCSKYAVKSLGEEDKSCRFRCSLRPAIGGAYLARFVDDICEAGLPLKGWFTLPGFAWTKGQRKGELVRFRLKGASARNACRQYAGRWLELRPNKVWPRTPFFTRYFPEELMLRREQWPETRLGMDWSPGPDHKPLRFREVERRVDPFAELNGVGFYDGQSEAIEAKLAAQKAEGEEFILGEVLYHQDVLARWLIGFRLGQAARAGLGEGDPVHDCYVTEGVVLADAVGEGAAKLRAIVFEEGDGLGKASSGAPIRQFQAQAARAESDRQARAIRSAGFEAVETCDAETGEVAFRAGAPLQPSARPDVGLGDCFLPWKPKAGGLAERAFAAAGTVARGFHEVKRRARA